MSDLQVQCTKSIREFAMPQISKYLSNADFKNNLIVYYFYAPSKFITHFDVKSQQEYDEYIEVNPPVTIKQETVKGYCEMEIANFLYRSGINYTYEKPYEFDVADSEYAGYHPDFYLDDYGIYIEFFAVDKSGNVPSYFTSKHGRNASEEYNAGILWKRQTHKQNGTILVEVSYADKQDNALTERLKQRLEKHGVKFCPKTNDELWTEVKDSERYILNSVFDVIGTVISLAKSRGYSYEQLTALNISSRNTPLLNLVRPIFDDYTKMLEESGQIDFNDMILTAADYVREKKFVSRYKYVIVDEYQDISSARYQLLKELRNSLDYNLFCVGDDWQSIYRFAGSDIGFILNFEKYWGNTTVSRIESTYRFSQSLIAISGRFIMKNPFQTQKALKSASNDPSFAMGAIEAYNDKKMIEFMKSEILKLERNCSVFFIGRYTYDKDIFNNSNFKVTYQNSTASIVVTLSSRPDLKMEFLTAHKSKGLQADYVFIINNKKKGMGFPSKIHDDPLIQLLLDGSDPYPFAEERRLFYVAMTRAKKKFWIVFKKNDKSYFAEELTQEYARYLKPPKKEEEKSRRICPMCGGRLILRTGQYGRFWGCSNYSKIGCRYKENFYD